MKKIVVKLTKKQISEMEIAKDGMGVFGLLAHRFFGRCEGIFQVNRSYIELRNTTRQHC